MQTITLHLSAVFYVFHFCHHSLSLFFLPADICIATAISLLMILICGMATYGAYKVRDSNPDQDLRK